MACFNIETFVCLISVLVFIWYCIIIAIIKQVQRKFKQILLSKKPTVIKKRQKEGLISFLPQVFKKCYAFNQIQKESNILVQNFHPSHSSPLLSGFLHIPIECHQKCTRAPEFGSQ